MRTWQVHDPSYASDLVNPALAVSPWAGHRGFAYDLVSWRDPGLVVELGTHFGCSFFAFAQAVADQRLRGRLVAVDTWAGDPHAGEYGEEVIETVRRTIDAHFADLPLELLRSTFLEARGEVEDTSVDLLHIDGFHSYEAVREDYETWLPKLAEDGIVLFHDVANGNGYESPRFWQEVRAQHPGFMFPHSFGLGVLFPKGDRWLRELEEQGVVPWLQAYRWRAEGRLAAQQLEDTRAQLEERWGVVQRLEQMVRDRDAALAAQASLLEERWDVMRSMDEAVAARDAELLAVRARVQELEARGTPVLQDAPRRALARRLSALARQVHPRRQP